MMNHTYTKLISLMTAAALSCPGMASGSPDAQSALAPKSITRQISPENITALLKMVKDRKESSAGELERIVNLRDDTESIPIYRRELPAGIIAGTPRDIVFGSVSENGAIVIEKENERGFWDGRIKDLGAKLLRKSRRNTIYAYKGFLKEVKFRIVENSPSVLTIERTAEGVYEIIIDRALLEIEEVHILPFLMLALNHELNHPQLHEEFLGKKYDPLLREMAVLLADLDLFSQMPEHSKENARKALAALGSKGFNVYPYMSFLDAHTKSLKERILAAYSLAADKDAKRMNELEKYSVTINGKQVSIDFKEAIEGYAYENLQPEPQELHGYIGALERVFKVPLAIVKKSVLPSLFANFDLLKKLKWRKLDPSIKKAIIEEVMPKMAAIGGSDVRKKLGDILATSDYDMEIKVAAAKALLSLSSYRSLPVIRNPFFGREILSYLTDTRKSDRALLGDKRSFDDLCYLITLIGNIRISSPDLYNKVRAELASWTLYAKDKSAQLKEAAKKRGRPEDDKNAKRLLQICSASMEHLQQRLREYLGPRTLSAEDWAGRITFNIRPHGAFPEVPDNPKDHEMTADAIRLAIADPSVIREALFVTDGIAIREDDIERVIVNDFAEGMKKINYMAMIHTKDNKTYQVLFNTVRPSIFKGTEPDDGQIRDRVETEKLYLMSMGTPTAETLGGCWERAGVTIWTEEVLNGVTLTDLADEICSHDPYHARARWKEIMREHARIQFDLYRQSEKRLANFDAHGGNSNWVPAGNNRYKARLNDIGDLTVNPEPAMLLEQLFRLSLVIELAHEDALRDATAIFDLCDGILDSLGEAEGKKVLREITLRQEELSMPSPYSQEEINIRDEVKRYLDKRALSYIPDEVRMPFSKEVKMASRINYADMAGVIILIKEYVSRGFSTYKQSPWIWVYMNMKYFEAGGKGTPLYKACRKLYERIRADNTLLYPEGAARLNRLIDEEAERRKLGLKETRRLKAAASYENELWHISGELLADMFRDHGIQIAEHETEIGKLKDLISAVASDSVNAPTLLYEIGEDRKIKEIFKRMKGPGETSEVGLSDILKVVTPFAAQGLIERENIVKLFKSIDETELAKIAKYGYSESFWELISKDYKRFAVTINRLYRDDPGMIAPSLAVYLVSSKDITDEERGYLLKEIDLSITKEIMRILCTAKDCRGEPWGRLWLEKRTSLNDYTDEMLENGRSMITELAAVDFNDAVNVVCELLAALDPAYSLNDSFVGKAELVSKGGIRHNDLVRLICGLPQNILLYAFSRASKRDPGMIQTLLNMLEDAGYLTARDTILQVLSLDRRLAKLAREYEEARKIVPIPAEKIKRETLEEFMPDAIEISS